MWTFCGRYVNEHMVMHQESAGHKVALSMANLSVWCYVCDSYLDNHICELVSTFSLSVGNWCFQSNIKLVFQSRIKLVFSE